MAGASQEICIPMHKYASKMQPWEADLRPEELSQLVRDREFAATIMSVSPGEKQRRIFRT